LTTRLAVDTGVSIVTATDRLHILGSTGIPYIIINFLINPILKSKFLSKKIKQRITGWMKFSRNKTENRIKEGSLLKFVPVHGKPWESLGRPWTDMGRFGHLWAG